jgi:hypothetical protein
VTCVMVASFIIMVPFSSGALGAAAGVVGNGRAVAVEPGVAQPHDAGACHEVAG